MEFFPVASTQYIKISGMWFKLNYWVGAHHHHRALMALSTTSHKSQPPLLHSCSGHSSYPHKELQDI
ncbi:hypothetical protein NC653_034232 [Populus alba x Populus x berolinensis]|uniref:Uncharacterized protein n=1 Tax=Populus alba x Populus x berolinensis TaxID=444605 RepID=A0AAD6LMB0_9ROSI|nr:hypothetical protein NC653_034232 [Populus alba x Populus x berolinensis]